MNLSAGVSYEITFVILVSVTLKLIHLLYDALITLHFFTKMQFFYHNGCSTICSFLIISLHRTYKLNKAALKCTPVLPSTKAFFDFNEIWYVGRGRQVMHDCMQYNPIQSQGHEHSKVGNSTIFEGYLLPHL